MRKLTELDTAVHAEQNIITLDVTVDHAVLMQKLQRLKALCTHTQTDRKT